MIKKNIFALHTYNSRARDMQVSMLDNMKEERHNCEEICCFRLSIAKAEMDL